MTLKQQIAAEAGKRIADGLALEGVGVVLDASVMSEAVERFSIAAPLSEQLKFLRFARAYVEASDLNIKKLIESRQTKAEPAPAPMPPLPVAAQPSMPPEDEETEELAVRSAAEV